MKRHVFLNVFKKSIKAIIILLSVIPIYATTSDTPGINNQETTTTTLDFYPIEIAVKSPKITIGMGASHGWESIYIGGSDTNNYTYITLCTKNNNTYAYTKDSETGNYKWRITNDFIEILNKADKNNKVIEVKNRIIDNLYLKQEIVFCQNEIIEKYQTDKSYIPFKVDLPGSDYDKFYSLVLKNNIIVYVISGSLNDKSMLYNNGYKRIGLNKTEKDEYNNLCAISLKEYMDNDIPTLGNTENFSFYLQTYLKYLYDKNYPVFGNQYTSKTSANVQNRNYNKYREIKEEEGKEIAAAAKRYLNWAVEYIMGTENFDSEIMNGVKNWGKNKENDENSYKLNYWPEAEREFPAEKNGGKGNPVPYVKGGIDTPRTFWKKMQLSDYSVKLFGKETGYNFYNITTNSILSSYKSFSPGIGSRTFKYAGTDSLGFLTGVIAMSSLKDYTYTIHGRKAAKELDMYSKEVETLITPENYSNYHSQDVNTFLKEMTKISFLSLDGDYSGFNWKDIDFMTKVVPTFQDVRKGDFLICKTYGNGRIAVVTNVNRNLLEIVYIDEVIYGRTVKKEIKGFGDYTARRLIVYDKNTQEEEAVEDVLNMDADEELSTLIINCKYEQTQTDSIDDSNWRFIPNTGEYLILEMNNIELKNKSGIDLLKLYGNERYKAVICAKDRDYRSENNANNGNLYNNRASKFTVKYCNANPGIKKNYSIVRDEQNNAYGGPDIYRTTSMSNYLYINEDGKLCDKKDLNDSVEPIKVGIRPESAQKAYPGDDLIIGVEILSSKYKNITSYSKVWSKEKDYIAVYDKKMLWRANLYINEGENDWNNVHPWNTSDTSIEWFGENNWLVSDLPQTGGQCEIKEWTRWNDGETVTNSVAYGWGCWDSVNQFNNELINQRTAIGNYRNEHPESNFAALQWINTQTTAPGTGTGTERWKNYIFQKDAATDENGQNKISEINADVSVPGLSTYWDEKPRESFSSPKHDKYTSGTDCSGLVAMSANYSGNKYTLNNIDETEDFVEKTENTTTETNKSLAIYSDEWFLKPDEELNELGKQKKKIQQEILAHAVPGDILVKPRHVVIIQNLHYLDDNMLIIDYSQVDVIHSTKGLKDQAESWMVNKGTWENIQKTVTDYQLRRLKEK